MGEKQAKPEACIGCLVEAGKIDAAEFVILKTNFFMVNQDLDVPIPGFLIIGSRRHVFSADEFTVEEAEEFGKLVRLVRRGMRQIFDVKTVYLFQNEDSDSHFHLWMFPRMDWMEKFGEKVESVRPIINWAKAHMKTLECWEKTKLLIEKMRMFLNSPESLSQL
jgi:diadenosine tetraphosphate (Ap4A) HIT family hydrolase